MAPEWGIELMGRLVINDARNNAIRAALERRKAAMERISHTMITLADELHNIAELHHS